MKQITKETIDEIFARFAPTGNQVGRYDSIHAKAKELAYLILDATPSSTEQAHALTHLQMAVMTAALVIAINDDAVTVRLTHVPKGPACGWDHDSVRLTDKTNKPARLFGYFGADPLERWRSLASGLSQQSSEVEDATPCWAIVLVDDSGALVGGEYFSGPPPHTFRVEFRLGSDEHRQKDLPRLQRYVSQYYPYRYLVELAQPEA